MANGFIPESSLLLGIIPALILLYLSIRQWHEKFLEKIVFLLFIFGIISGFLIAIVQSQIYFTFELLFIYPLLEQIIKVIILNLRRFQERKETIIYGLSLGLGFGSIYPPASLLLLSNEIYSPITLVQILLGSIGLVFLHGITGALLGYGIYQGKLPRFYIYSVLILIIANFIRLDYQLQWINLIFGCILYWYVQTNIIKKEALPSGSRKRTKRNET
jgi:RsiW-degrading membrane proteinase PrsW (M82 family)